MDVDHRFKASEFLQELEGEIAAQRRAGKETATDASELLSWIKLTEYKLAGFVYRVGDVWLVDSPNKLPPETVLFALEPQGKKTAKMIEIGTVNSGKLSVLNSKTPPQAGRPLFTLTTSD